MRRCKACPCLYLCETCFVGGSHSDHSFDGKPTPHAKWEPAARAVEPKLPSGVIADFQNRELTDGDYELLLTLDAGPQPQGSIPLHVINSFPVVKLTGDGDRKRLRLDQDGTCKVCVAKIRHGELTRQIPCGHGFHQACIGKWVGTNLDRWLMHSRATCPSCGVAAFTSLVQEDEGAPSSNSATYVAAAPQYPSVSKIRRKRAKPAPPQTRAPEPILFIAGSDAFSHSASPGLIPLLRSQGPIRHPISLPPLTTRRPEADFALAAEALCISGARSLPLATAQPTAKRPARHLPGEAKRLGSLAGKSSFGLPPVPTPRRQKVAEAPVELAPTFMRFGGFTSSQQ
ncbi:E3 ubiquitin-protein ligase Zswim2 [Kappamyces sp. JEL0680]|nr:E3 ubiquitin-protein ligase Zswim2 [Kappamyces sp. JEL0680]